MNALTTARGVFNAAPADPAAQHALLDEVEAQPSSSEGSWAVEDLSRHEPNLNPEARTRLLTLKSPYARWTAWSKLRITGAELLQHCGAETDPETRKEMLRARAATGDVLEHLLALWAPTGEPMPFWVASVLLEPAHAGRKPAHRLFEAARSLNGTDEHFGARQDAARTLAAVAPADALADTHLAWDVRLDVADRHLDTLTAADRHEDLVEQLLHQFVAAGRPGGVPLFVAKTHWLAAGDSLLTALVEVIASGDTLDVALQNRLHLVRGEQDRRNADPEARFAGLAQDALVGLRTGEEHRIRMMLDLWAEHPSLHTVANAARFLELTVVEDDPGPALAGDIVAATRAWHTDVVHLWANDRAWRMERDRVVPSWVAAHLGSYVKLCRSREQHALRATLAQVTDPHIREEVARDSVENRQEWNTASRPVAVLTLGVTKEAVANLTVAELFAVLSFPEGHHVWGDLAAMTGFGDVQVLREVLAKLARTCGGHVVSDLMDTIAALA